MVLDINVCAGVTHIEALKNAPETIVLEPGKSFTRAVEAYVVSARPVKFRL